MDEKEGLPDTVSANEEEGFPDPRLRGVKGKTWVKEERVLKRILNDSRLPSQTR